MTRIWLLSDLHLEASDFDLPPTPAGAKVLVIAGDVSETFGWTLNMCLGWRRRSGLPVVFVPGNHDFFGADLHHFEGQPAVVAGLDGEGVHVLHSGQVVVLGGTRFIGATLWTDFKISGDQEAAMRWFDHHMPDAARVHVGNGFDRITGHDVLPVHRRHLAAIEAVLATPFDGPTMVVTHHAPHPKSLPVPDIIDEGDGSFASDLASTIERYKPTAWLHGHVHSTLDYRVGETRIVANARGYARGGDVENRHFDPEFVIDV